jgi:hypothetical protein
MGEAGWELIACVSWTCTAALEFKPGVLLGGVNPEECSSQPQTVCPPFLSPRSLELLVLAQHGLVALLQCWWHPSRRPALVSRLLLPFKHRLAKQACQGSPGVR